MSLARQYLIAASAVLFSGMLAIGIWVTGQVADAVTRNTAIATALYVDGVIAPLLATVDEALPLTEGVRRALDEVTSEQALGARISAFKLWRPDGEIAYSSRPELVGRVFEPTPNLLAAFEGRVTAEFNQLSDGEDEFERALGRPLLEVYSPVREPWSGRVVAVAEFYEYADELQETLVAMRLRSWLVVGGATLLTVMVLFGIVLRGSRLIDRQQAELEARVSDLSALLARNAELSASLRGASGRVAAENERYRRRVSADLHDGPAQLLALASLRLGASGGDTVEVRGILAGAMDELRAICRGLALPEIETLPVDGVVAAAVDAHRTRTGTEVAVEGVAGDVRLGPSERICVYRFVQEALNNAARHAGGARQAVSVRRDGGQLDIAVSDAGPGFDPASVPADRLGLSGLRDRIESLGGRLRVESSPAGTTLTMTLAPVSETP